MKTELPPPDDAAREHSAALRRLLIETIEEQGGAIPFHRFMELLLYAPGLGYYSAGSHKLGAGGDFITAPELSPLFGAAIANAIRPVLEQLPRANILELGAGSGALARSVLSRLEMLRSPAERYYIPAERYYILEVSADLRDRQQRHLSANERATPITWLEQLPEAFVGVVLANEVLDAMPVHLFEKTGQGVQERYVKYEGDRFVWSLGEPSDPRIQPRVDAIEQQLGEPLPIGYVSEINLAAEDWLASLAAAVQQGYVLMIDYGFPRHEYYHPQRRQGTLMCHYRHHSHADPFQYIGLQDVTAHIDFTAMADAALGAGWDIAGYTSQAHFLLGSGLTELVATEAQAIDAEQLALHAQIKKLTLPHEMGELFKVMGLQKQCAISLAGFQLYDMRDRL